MYNQFFTIKPWISEKKRRNQSCTSNTWRHNMTARIIGTGVYVNTVSTFLRLPFPFPRRRVLPTIPSSPVLRIGQYIYYWLTNWSRIKRKAKNCLTMIVYNGIAWNFTKNYRPVLKSGLKYPITVTTHGSQDLCVRFISSNHK